MSGVNVDDALSMASQLFRATRTLIDFSSSHFLHSWSYVRLSRLVDGLLILQQVLDCLDVLLADRMQQRVFHLDPLFQEQLYQLNVLVLDRRYERRAVERVNAVDVELGRLASEVGDYSKNETKLFINAIRSAISVALPSHGRTVAAVST